MAIFRFEEHFSTNRINIFCQSKLELIESLYHEIYVRIEDLKILFCPDEDNYMVIMIAPYREKLLIGYINEIIE